MEPSATRPTDPPTSTAGRVLGIVLLLPAAWAALAGLLVPTLSTLQLSLQDVSPMGASAYVGGRNYSEVLATATFYSSVGFTLLIALERVAVVGVVPLLLGLGTAALRRGSQRLLRVVFTLPIALYLPVMTALAWRLYLAQDAPLREPGLNRLALLLVDAFSVGALACGLGLAFYLAAQRRAPSDGGQATPTRATLLVWAVSLVAAIASGLQAFTLSHLLTGGGPALTTRTWMLHVFQEGFQRMAFGPAAASSSMLLIPLLLLSTLTGLGIILGGIYIDHAPAIPAEAPPRRGLRYVLLILGLLGGLGLCVLSALPLVSLLGAGLDPEAMAQTEGLFPTGRTLANTLLPLAGAVFLVIMPVTYLGALGIGALRPLGRRSELLLLPFSPWLLVGTGPLAIAFFQRVRVAGLLGTFPALVPPVALSVPILFILTLFFRGRFAHWQTRRAEGNGDTSAFLQAVIAPSLPLALLLGLGAVFAGAGELLWPLLMSVRPDTFPVSVALAQIGGQAPGEPAVAGALVRLGLPLVLGFFVLFVLAQVLYLDRLRIAHWREDGSA